MELLKKYNKALQDIYDHVGFKEDWVIFPIDDNTQYYWNLDDEIVRWAESIEELNDQEDECYSGSIYKQEFYDKHVYRGKDITLVFLDTQTDGMKYFAIFDNSKEIHTHTYR